MAHLRLPLNRYDLETPATGTDLFKPMTRNSISRLPDQFVPESKKPKLANKEIIMKPLNTTQQKALDVLEKMKKFDLSNEVVIETIRQIRKDAALP